MPMQGVAPKPLRRLRVKTQIQKPKQTPLRAVDDWAKEEKHGSRRQVYLVTFPHPRTRHSACGRKLVAPGSVPKKHILQCLLDACANPDYTDARSLAWKCAVALKHAGVWREYHQADPDGSTHAHDHATVLAQPKKNLAFLRVKKALLRRHGLATHWSCTHTGYWSAIRYVSVPSPKKPLGALDVEPELWSAVGEHPPLETCRHEPLTAAALRARTEKKFVEAAEAGGKERLSELDVWPLLWTMTSLMGPTSTQRT